MRPAITRALVPAVIAVSIALTAAVAAQKNAADPVLTLALAQASAYLDRFEASFSNVVSEEDYEQRVMPATGVYNSGFQVLQRRLRSDFTLVQVPGDKAWLPFRDVFEVDGAPVRDRSDRLARLFLAPSTEALTSARQIMAESARYNIGNLNRTINVPVLAFEVIRGVNQRRFAFTRDKPDRRVDPAALVVRFREVARPSFITGPNGTDVFTSGRIWLLPDTGLVLQTFITVDAYGAHAEITTRFRANDAFGVAIPVEMDERYTRARSPDVIGTATYSAFRKFGVEVSTATTK